MDWPSLVQSVGIPGALVVFYTIESRRREERMSRRIDEVENFNRVEMSRLVQDCTLALNRNSEVMQQFVAKGEDH